MDTIIAGVRYALSRYGSMSNVPGIRAVNSGGYYAGYSYSSRGVLTGSSNGPHHGCLGDSRVRPSEFPASSTTNSYLMVAFAALHRCPLRRELGTIMQRLKFHCTPKLAS